MLEQEKSVKSEKPNEKETGRIEAFSDGVFAIAITLLALDLKVPPVHTPPAPGQLGLALLAEWPVYLAYVTSFLSILVMWVNHHRLFQDIVRTDQAFLILNGLLLMVVTLVPFPTSMLAQYLATPDARMAATIYSALFLLMALGYNVLWRYASRNGHLLRPDYDPHRVQSISRQYRNGPLFYVVALVLCFAWVPASVGLSLALAVYFALPGRSKKIEGA